MRFFYLDIKIRLSQAVFLLECFVFISTYSISQSAEKKKKFFRDFLPLLFNVIL